MLRVFNFNQQTVIALFSIFLCFGLLFLSVPRFIASLYALYPEATINQLSNNLPTDVYRKSIVQLEHALAWDNNPEYWQNKALLHLTLSRDISLSKTDQQLALIDAFQSIVKGLQGSPVDPYAWYRLAVVESNLGMPGPAINSLLQMSILAGRVEPDLIMPRLILGMIYFNFATPELREIWVKQFLLAWQFQPKVFVEFVVNNPGLKPLVDAAFLYDADQFSKFNNAFERTIQKSFSKKSH